MFLDFRSLWESTGGAVTFFKSLAGTLTFDGSLTKRVGKQAVTALQGTLTLSGNLVKQVGKSLSGTLLTTGAITAIAKHLVLLNSTLTFAGNLTKQAGKALGGTLTFQGILTTTVHFIRSLSGTLTLTGALTKRVWKQLSGTLIFSGTLLRSVAILTLGGTLTFTGQFATWWKLLQKWLPAFWERHDDQPMPIPKNFDGTQFTSDKNPNIEHEQDRNRP